MVHEQSKLKDVTQVEATESAFAAVLGGGSVVTWGSADDGSDVQRRLSHVQKIQGSCCNPA